MARPLFRHLFRGSPAVRGWSKYQATEPAWTLCGSKTQLNVSEDLATVTCPYCLELATHGDGRSREIRPICHSRGVARSPSRIATGRVESIRRGRVIFYEP